MFKQLTNTHRNVIAYLDYIGDYKLWLRPGCVSGVVGMASFFCANSINAQSSGGGGGGGVTVPDMNSTLTAAKTNIKSIMDWVIVIAIAAAFVIAIYGIVVGLARIFSGRGEGVGTMVVGIAAAIVGIGLISVFVTGYNSATS